MEKAKAKGVSLYFPVDYVTADKFDKNASVGYSSDETGIPAGWMVSRSIGVLYTGVHTKSTNRAWTAAKSRWPSSAK